MSLEKKLFYWSIGIWILSIIVYLFIQYGLGGDVPTAGCMFLRVTGLYCPGCGGTRAFLHMMQGHFIQAFVYHPLVVYGYSMLFLFTVSHFLQIISGDRWKIGLRFHGWYLYAALVILVVYFITENVLLIMGIGLK